MRYLLIQLLFAAFVVQQLQTALARSNCVLEMSKVPNLYKSDSAGKRCTVDVLLPGCRGFCKSSEQGTHRFPHSHHNSSMEKVRLSDCEEGFDTAFAWIEVPTVQHCHCAALPLA